MRRKSALLYFCLAAVTSALGGEVDFAPAAFEHSLLHATVVNGVQTKVRATHYVVRYEQNGTCKLIQYNGGLRNQRGSFTYSKTGPNSAVIEEIFRSATQVIKRRIELKFTAKDRGVASVGVDSSQVDGQQIEFSISGIDSSTVTGDRFPKPKIRATVPPDTSSRDKSTTVVGASKDDAFPPGTTGAPKAAVAATHAAPSYVFMPEPEIFVRTEIRPATTTSTAVEKRIYGVALYYGSISEVRFHERSKEWLEAAAKEGDARATVMLGCIIEDEGDQKRAVDLFLDGLAKGDGLGAYLAARHFKTGSGVEIDNERVYKLLSVAFTLCLAQAEKGDARSMDIVGRSYSEGIAVEADEEKAFNWFLRGAKAGDSDAMADVGCCYESGRGVANSRPATYAWFKRSADHGNRNGMFRLGHCFQEGTTGYINRDISYKWYYDAACLGSPEGQFAVGICEATGVGTQKNYDRAVYRFRTSAERGIAPAMYQLAQSLTNDWTQVKKDSAEAEKWLNKSVQLGYVPPPIVTSNSRSPGINGADFMLGAIGALIDYGAESERASEEEYQRQTQNRLSR